VNRRSLLINSIILFNESSIIQWYVTYIFERDVSTPKVLIDLNLTLINLINYGHVITGNDVYFLK
jgi:hypothetical protein